ncbi:MAG: DMT family transporter [Thermoplasmatota archaeon]
MTDHQRTKTIKSYFFYVIIILPILFWALAFPVIKIGLKELSAVNLTIMRLFLVCIVFIIVSLMYPNRLSPLQKKDILPIFLLGFFGIVVYHLGLNYGELYISASAASLIIATIPLFTILLSVLFLKEKITRSILLGFILSFVGIIIISFFGTPHVTLEIVYISGAITVLIASLMGAIYTTAGKNFLKRYSPLSLTIYAFLLGSLGLIPFISSSLFTQVANLSSTGWASVIFLALFPTVISYSLWYVALELKKASELSLYLYAIPVISTTVSTLLFNESITILFIIGGILVLLGLVIVNTRNKHIK